MTNLALIYLDAGRVTEAVSLNEQALRLYKETLGPGRPSHARFHAHFGHVL